MPCRHNIFFMADLFKGWVPRRSMTTMLRYGCCGMAVYRPLDMVVVSSYETRDISVHLLRGTGLEFAYTLGGRGSPPPMHFKFLTRSFFSSGKMAFVEGDTPSKPLLLVTDAGQGAVHVIDVVGRRHAGYVGSLGSIPGARAVAARGPLAAVSSWADAEDAENRVCLCERTESAWVVLRAVGAGRGGADGQYLFPYDLRFTRDGHGLVVADYWNDRMTLFRVGDGGFVRHIAHGSSMSPYGIEELENGWLVASHCLKSVVSVGGDGGGAVSVLRAFNEPTCMSLVPGVGLLVLDGYATRVHVIASPDDVAMQRMSLARTAWMGTVARAAPQQANRLLEVVPKPPVPTPPSDPCTE
jgi:hypothetical protein